MIEMTFSNSNSINIDENGTVESEAIQVLKSIQRTAEEVNALSGETVVVVNSQYEQVKAVESSSERVSSNLNLSDQLVRGIKSFTGRLVGIFSSGGERKEEAVKKEVPKMSEYQRSFSSVESSSPQKRFTTTMSGERSSFDDSCDETLDHISYALQSIKEKSFNISESIKSQNSSLEKVNSSIDSSRERIAYQHNQIRK